MALPAARAVLCAAVLSGLSALPIYAEPVPNAADFLKQSTAAPATAGASIEQRAKSLAAAMPQLAPEEAARRWLELIDAEAADNGRNGRESFRRYNEVDGVMQALPAPSAWPALADAIAKRPLPDAAKDGGQARRRELALQLMGKVLVGNTQGVGEQADELTKLLPRHERLFITRGRESLKAILTSAAPAAADASTEFETSLAETAAGGPETVFPVPDLVTLVGEEQARVLLEKALAARVMLYVAVGDKTRDLAAALALKHLDKLTVPQWKLVSPNTVELYEALSKKFPVRKGGWFSRGSVDRHAYDRQQATQHYLLGLIIAGRVDDALKILETPATEDAPSPTLDVSDLSALDEAGHTAKVLDTVDALLTRRPDLPLWEIYRSLAARTGKTDRMVALAEKKLADADPKSGKTAAIQTELVLAFVAADRLDDAERLAEPLLAPSGANPDQRFNTAIRFATIGRLTNKPAWVERGLKVAGEALSSWQADSENQYQRARAAQELVTELMANRLYTQAMQRIAAELGRGMAEEERNLAEHLITAAQVYHDNKQYADVLELLRTAPAWGAPDLSGILTRSGSGDKARPIGFLAASSLFETGQKDQARTIVNALLNADSDLDPAYELLLKLGDDQALATLDELWSRDKFQERPLIWKAEALRRAGRLDDAETAAKQAIAIDPSDGDTGHDDRMRVYGVMADIFKDRGNAEREKFFRDVVAAIRLSEQADDLWEAGLLKRAVDLYQKSLTYFADAYCIQSRLAIKMSELGFHDAAAAHYRKAYELMPDSFGRVESHCFGCEGAFKGNGAQHIAEKVFTDAALKTPQKPQVHYLLGYLRQEQGRHAEALDSFRTAVKLDPAYLNAWKKITNIAERAHLPQADRDAAALALLKLDPLRRHSRGNLEDVRDLKALWQTVEAVQQTIAPRPGNLLPLVAAAAMLQAEPAGYSRSWTSADDEVLTPASAVAGTKPLATLRRAMTGSEW